MSTSEITALTARVAHLQALNRTYLTALRGTEESHKPYDELVAQLQARVRELEARPPAPPQPATDTVLGCTPAQFLVGMEIILRDTRKPFREAFALWQAHAAECAEERQAEAVANASREGLRAYLASQLLAGMPQKKAICACGEWDCPTHDLTYVEGRGFLNKWDDAEELERLEEERAAAAAAAKKAEEERAFAAAQANLSRFCTEANAEILAGAAARAVPEKARARPMTWAERVLAGTK